MGNFFLNITKIMFYSFLGYFQKCKISVAQRGNVCLVNDSVLSCPNLRENTEIR